MSLQRHQMVTRTSRATERADAAAMSEGEFSVYQYFADESCEAVARFVDPENRGQAGQASGIGVTCPGDITEFRG